MSEHEEEDVEAGIEVIALAAGRTMRVKAISAASTHVSCAPLGRDELFPAHLMSSAIILYREASLGSSNCLVSHDESKTSGTSSHKCSLALEGE